MSKEIYDILFFLAIYSFFGWCLEVVYQAVEHGKFINRGFLNGPYCPIYGFGAVLVCGALQPIAYNFVYLYAGAVVLTSALELLTGFVLDKIFHMHWWDYSGERLNFHGYICLKFSLLWGVACLVMVKSIQPAVSAFVARIPTVAGDVFLVVFYIAFACDFVTTVLAIVRFKKRLVVIEKVSADMRKISDKTGEKIFGAVEDVMTKKEELDRKSAEARRRLEELREKYKAQLASKGANIRRIEKAFPKLSFDLPASFREKLDKIRNDAPKK